LFPEYDFKPRHLLLVANGSAYPHEVRVVPDSTNAQTAKIVCSSLTSDECERWKSCCSAARDCCRQQLQAHSTHVNDTCPPTWDGFSCWNAGVPGESSLITCPNFLPYSIPTSTWVF
jgi:calcitonin receptor-like